jgi:hypothetical protein
MNLQTWPRPTLPDEIVLSDSGQIDFWCARLGCSAAELANAIGDVGFSAAAVEEHLRKLRLPSQPG